MPKPIISWYAEYEASTLGLANGALVTTWPDVGAVSARNLVSSVADDRPVFVAVSSELNGAAAVSFNGTTNRLWAEGTPFGTVNQAYTFVLVAVMDQKTTAQTPVCSYIDDASTIVNWQAEASNHATTPNRLGVWAGSPYLAAGSGGIGAAQVIVVQINGGTSHIRVNGVSVVSGAAGDRPLTGLVLGQKREQGVWSLPTAMRVAYFAVKAGVLTAQEQLDLESWADQTFITPAGTVPQGTVTISAVAAGGSSASVTYAYSASDQTGFEYRINGGTWASIGASPATISGLTGQTTYNTPGIEIRAINAQGGGTASAPAAFTTRRTEYKLVTDGYQAGPTHSALYHAGFLYYSTVRYADNYTLVHRMYGGTTTTMTVATFAREVHNNASFAVDNDNTVWCVYCEHGISTAVYIRKSTTAYGIDFGAPLLVDHVTAVVRYPRIVITSDGTMWLFYNADTTRDIVYRTSTDKGVTWSATAVLWQSTAPYFEVEAFGNEIAVVTSNGHAEDMALGTSSGYFMRWNGTAWVNAANTAYVLPVNTTTGQVCYNAATDTRNLGFWPQVAKTSSGWRIFVSTWISNTIYKLEWAGSAWSQQAVLLSSGKHSVALENEYSVFVTKTDQGATQLARLSSGDLGVTWTIEYFTGLALLRERGELRRIYGAPASMLGLIYSDQTRVANDWTADLYALFNATTIPNTRIRYQIKSNGTPVANESDIKYALFDGTDPTAWAQIGSGTLASDSTGYVSIATSTTPPNTARFVLLTKNNGTNLDGTGAQGPVRTEVAE